MAAAMPSQVQQNTWPAKTGKMLKQLKEKVSHKLSFWKKEKFKKIIVEYGVPFLVILIGWEIFEDIIFPAICYWLGQYWPAFYAAIPTLWIVCLHPVVVPVLWWAYVKFWGSKNKKEYECDHGCTHDTPHQS